MVQPDDSPIEKALARWFRDDVIVIWRDAGGTRWEVRSIGARRLAVCVGNNEEEVMCIPLPGRRQTR